MLSGDPGESGNSCESGKSDEYGESDESGGSDAECDIRENFDTNECPNIFVSTKLHE